MAKPALEATVADMSHRRSEELDDVDFAVDGELLDRPQALRGD